MEAHSQQALQQRISELEAELASSRAALRDFTYAVSHDLRAPLRHLVSFAQLLEEEAGPQLAGESIDFLQTIRSSATHLGELLEALAALSRIEALPVQTDVVDIGALLRACWADVLAADPGRPVSVSWEIAPDLQWATDAALLRRVFTEVLGNAFKFTARTVRPEIHVHAAVDIDQALLCRVQDNGAGFNPAQRDKLFKVFSRLHSVKQFPGLGMGLLIASRLLAKLDGRMALDAEPAGGVVATIRLAPEKKNPA
jgi:signal transduction histidine kinase